MKFSKQVAVLSLVFSLFLMSSCKRDIDTYVPDNNNLGQTLNPSPVLASVTGKVVDENEIPVAGATVFSGSHSTSTDSRGLFRFDHITMDKYASVVTVVYNNYFKGIRTFSATEGSANFVRIKLIPKILAGTINSATGGEVTLSNNALIGIQGNSVVLKTTLQPYTGTVNVYAVNIDPTSTDISQIIPGSFQAIDANNFRVLLKSYGMLAVQLEGQSGEILDIASGHSARVRFAIPATLSSEAASTVPLWSLNEVSGLWKPEGNASLVGGYYEANVMHFSFWNCDASANSIYFETTITSNGHPLPAALVKITMSDSGYYNYGYTDSTGHVGGMVFSGRPMLLQVISNCNDVIYSQNIGPYNQNTNLGTIDVTMPAQVALTITGHAIDCNSNPVTNGSASIYWEGQLITVPINNGSFSTTITRCSNNTATLEVIATDHTGNQQGSTWSGTASSGTVDVDTLSACGISNLEFVNYSINGIDYSIAPPAGSVIQSSIQGNTASLFTAISTTDTVDFVIDYPGITVGSNQQLQSFSSHHIANAATYTLTPTVFANITEFGSVGQYVAGHFTGTVVTSGPNNTYDISCSFRIKRTF